LFGVFSHSSHKIHKAKKQGRKEKEDRKEEEGQRKTIGNILNSLFFAIFI